MKNKLIIFPFLLALIAVAFFIYVIGNPITDIFLNFNYIYRTENDKYLSNIIESTFKQIVKSQSEKKYTNNELNKINVNVKLDNIDKACYFISVYSTGYFDNKMQEALSENGIESYPFTRDIKRKMLSRRGGEGSSSILFIKNDGTIFPIFPPGSYLDMDFPAQTLYKHPYPCEKVPNGNVDINVSFNAKQKNGKLTIKY